MEIATRLLVSAAALYGAALVPAFAGDTWAGAYGGTIVSTYSDGRVVKVYVNVDHSYSITLPNGATLKGIWADADGQSCFTTTDPPQVAGTKPACFPIKDYKIGDTFAGEDVSGKFTGVIVAGR
jgi:streptogramin lyase